MVAIWNSLPGVTTCPQPSVPSVTQLSLNSPSTATGPKRLIQYEVLCTVTDALAAYYANDRLYQAAQPLAAMRYSPAGNAGLNFSTRNRRTLF